VDSRIQHGGFHNNVKDQKEEVTAAHIHGLSGDISGLPSRKRRQGLDLSSDFVAISLCRPPAKPAAQNNLQH
jgi:hypothetical protein